MRGHHVELADGSRSEKLLRLGINDRAHALASDLDNPVRRARGLDHLRPIGVEMDHRLLAIDILARLHRIDRDLFVPVIRRADDDGVNILTRQNLFVVACREDVVAPEFLAVFEPPVVTVRHGDQLHARNLHRNLRVSLALTTGPDQRDLNVIVGRHRRCGLSLRRCKA